MLSRKSFFILFWIMILASAAEAADIPTIGLSVGNDTNPFCIAIRQGIDAKAKELGVNVAYITANEVISQQVNGIQDLIARKVDALLVSPIDAVAVGSAYEAAAKAGIPMVSMVRPSKSPFENRSVTMDWKALGTEIGDWTTAKLSHGQIAMLRGPAGGQMFRDLASGYKDAVAKHSKLKIVFEQDGASTREVGLKEAEGVLTAHPDISAIYAGNDELALWASQAVAAAGKTGQVIITGLNGVPPAIKPIKDGNISLTVDRDGRAWGAVVLETAVSYAQGKVPTDEQIKLRSKLIDKTKVAEYLVKAAR